MTAPGSSSRATANGSQASTGCSPGDIATIQRIYQIWETVDVARVYAKNGSKNCLIMPRGQGWIRIDPDDAGGVSNLFDQARFALAFGKRMQLYKDGSKIYRGQLL